MKKLHSTSRPVLPGDGPNSNPTGVRITPKRILWAVVVLVAFSFMMLNRETVEVSFLFLDFRMSQWLLLLLTFVLGGVLGYIMSSWRSRDGRARDDD
jgi:uncharacterized integral membrane protein